MAIYTKPSEAQHELIPAGRHIGVLADIVLKPSVQTSYGLKDKLQFRFQLPYSHTTTGRKQMAFLTLNNSSDKRSKLWEVLELWIGNVPVERRPRFDLEQLIGKSAELLIVHTPGEGRIYANIKAIFPAPQEEENIPVEDYQRESERALASTVR